MSTTGITRTAPQLFRDCLRLVNHIAGKSKKGAQLRRIVGGEFRKNAQEKDEERIANLKSNAIRALANYLMIESASKDARVKESAASYTSRQAKSISSDDHSEREARPSSL